MISPNFSLITTLLLVFLTAIAGGLVAKKFRQSMIIGYIIAGILVGSIGSGWLGADIVTLVSSIGITLLLFTLGVEFSFRRLAGILRTITWAATAQIVIVMLLVLLALTTLSGFSLLSAFVFAAAAALSSTAIVVKVLSERGELDTQFGEVSIGWLVVQDLSVIPIMIMLPAFVLLSSGAGTGVWPNVMATFIAIAKALCALILIVVLGKHGIPRILSYVVRVGSRELFLLSTVGLVLLSAAASSAIGISPAIGAFIAGLLVAETSQNHAVFAEVRPLRDLFAIIFFVTIGMALPWHVVLSNWLFIVGCTIAIVGIKGITTYGLMHYLGYHKKTGFFVALSLLQMSEFGFILSQEGLALGLISSDQAGLLSAITFLSIVVGTTVFFAKERAYRFFSPMMPDISVTRKRAKSDVSASDDHYPIDGHVVICGYGRVGKYIGRALLMAKIPFLVVDYNHATVSSLKAQGIPVVYGDPADKEVLDYAEVDHASAVVIAIPDRHTQELIIGHALTLNKKIKIMCRTHHEEDQPHLKSLGAQTVVQPEFEAALTISERLLDAYGVSEEGIAGKVSRLKIEHGMG